MALSVFILFLLFDLPLLILCPRARVVEVLLPLTSRLLLAVLPWPVFHGFMIPVRKIGPLLESFLLPLLLIHVELFWHLTPAPTTTHLLLLALLVSTIVVLGDLFSLT